MPPRGSHRPDRRTGGLAELGLHALLGDALHGTLGTQAMAVRAAMVPTLSPSRRANSCSCGRRAMLPSSFITSHSTPAGFSRREPGTGRPPPRCGRHAHQYAAAPRAQRRCARGGQSRSRPRPDRRVRGWSRRGQRDDTPVVVPARRSTETVNAVRCDCAVDGHHSRQLEAVELLFRHGHADDAAGVAVI